MNTVSQLEDYVKDASEKIKQALVVMDKKSYVKFLDIMYHYTKHSEKNLQSVADLSHTEELKEYFHHMSRDERGHYLLAKKDLKALGEEVSDTESQEVVEFNTNWEALASDGVYGYLGAIYVFENVAKHLQKEGVELLQRLQLQRNQCTWVGIHLQADLEHGEEIKEMCEKYSKDKPEAVLNGAKTMYIAWINVILAASN